MKFDLYIFAEAFIIFFSPKEESSVALYSNAYFADFDATWQQKKLLVTQ